MRGVLRSIDSGGLNTFFCMKTTTPSLQMDHWGTCKKRTPGHFFGTIWTPEIQNPSKQRRVLISRHITVSTFFAIFSAWYSANWFWTRWTLEKNFGAAVEVHSLYHSLIHLHSAAASWECMAIRMFQPGEKGLSFLHTTNGKLMKTVSTWT